MSFQKISLRGSTPWEGTHFQAWHVYKKGGKKMPYCAVSTRFSGAKQKPESARGALTGKPFLAKVRVPLPILVGRFVTKIRILLWPKCYE